MASISSCSCCYHKDVCAFCERYKNAIQAVDTAVKAIQADIEDLEKFNMRVTVQCPYYVLPPNIR